MESSFHLEKIILFKVQQEDFTFKLKMSLSISETQKMTLLLYLKDYIKTKLKITDVKYYFDEDNPTNEEEILQEGLEQVLVKYGAFQQPDFTVEKSKLITCIQDITDKEETLYVNNKNQLVKITPVERNGRMTELHQILSFDIDKLPQASQHKYGTEEKKDGESTPKFNQAPIPRVKVPVKDGMSQSQSKTKQQLVQNANETFYTLEEIGQHNKEDDCWTVLNGRVYDVTEYAKVHPGGRKIFLGKGKDCTELYNKYHPWVNGAYLIGKYQVGVLKRTH